MNCASNNLSLSLLFSVAFTDWIFFFWFADLCFCCVAVFVRYSLRRGAGRASGLHEVRIALREAFNRETYFCMLVSESCSFSRVYVLLSFLRCLFTGKFWEVKGFFFSVTCLYSFGSFFPCSFIVCLVLFWN